MILIKFLSSDPSNRTSYFMNNIDEILSHKFSDFNRPTVMFCHGWTQNADSSMTKLITKAYLKRNSQNFLILDWGDYSNGFYDVVRVEMSRMSRVFGKKISSLFDKGLNVKSFHCVGHSFGAHACGIIGRELIQSSKGKHKFGRFVKMNLC